jgi:hypothetical protein
VGLVEGPIASLESGLGLACLRIRKLPNFALLKRAGSGDVVVAEGAKGSFSTPALQRSPTGLPWSNNSTA